MSMKQKLKKPAIVLVWLFLWQMASVWLGHELLLVSPLRTAETLFYLMQDPNYWAPMISVMKATPVASFIILALLWVGSAHISTLCSFVMGMPIIYSNMYHGLFSIDKMLLEVGQMFQMSRKRQITDIYIPSLKPHLQAAIMVGIGFCWKSGVAAEVIGLANNTIGVHLYNAKVYLETPELFAWTVTIIILSVSIEKLLVSVLNRM